MKSDTINNYVYHEFKGLKLYCSLYKATDKRKGKAIIYIHGGGLLYGSRNDIPENYIALFLEAGYDILTLDYPLAPEAKLPDILDCLSIGIKWFKDSAISVLHLQTSEYFLFGRSAGAFLSLILTSKFNLKPLGIVSFYGYFSLRNKGLFMPNPYYTSFSQITKKMADRLLYPAPVAEASLEARYMLYVYYRQQGSWLDSFLSSPYEKTIFSLKDEDLAAMPPAFLTASLNDTDVPYSETEYMSEHIKNNFLFPVEGTVHDFDRDISKTVGTIVYNKVIAWMNKFN